MAAKYEAKPPGYTDPSAADDISSLLQTALAVQDSLSKAKSKLEDVDEISETHLLLRLREVDEKYAKLLNESRTSANYLYAAIQGFLSATLVIAFDTNHSVNTRAAAVKESADKIARSAREDLRPYDERVVALKSDLQSLHDSLVAILNGVKKDKEQLLTELTRQSSNTNIGNGNQTSQSGTGHPLSKTDNADIQATGHSETTHILEKLLASLFSWFSAPKRKHTLDHRAPEIAALKKDIASTTAAFDSVLNEISSLIHVISGLIGKLGHFGTVWDKLADDSARLSNYLETSRHSQDEIDNTVQREIGVYKKISHALDEFRLGV